MSNDAFKANRGLTSTAATAATGILFVVAGQLRGGGVQLSGVFVGTVQFEESIDGGATWFSKAVFPVGGGGAVTSATATGDWKFALGGSTHFRAQCSAFTSGTIQVDIALTEGVDPIAMSGGGSAGTPGGGVESVQGFGYTSTVSFARTADTNAYTANDVVGAATGATAALAFANIGPAGGGPVFLTTARFEIDVSAVPSGMGDFLLYFYSVTPPSALGDNAAWDLPAGDRPSFRGFIDLGTPVDLGSTLYVEVEELNKQIDVPVGGTLFAYLVTSAGYTPTSAAVYKGVLHSIGI